MILRRFCDDPFFSQESNAQRRRPPDIPGGLERLYTRALVSFRWSLPSTGSMGVGRTPPRGWISKSSGRRLLGDNCLLAGKRGARGATTFFRFRPKPIFFASSDRRLTSHDSSFSGTAGRVGGGPRASVAQKVQIFQFFDITVQGDHKQIHTIGLLDIEVIRDALQEKSARFAELGLIQILE
jgi:hypothetical protein